MVTLFAANTAFYELHELEKFVPLFEKKKRAAIGALIRNEDRKRAILAFLLLKKTIKDNLNINLFKLETNEFGKPFLKGHEDFHFNISHSRDWVVCACGAAPVGVDIEFVRAIDLDLAVRYFSAEDCRGLFEKEQAGRIRHFYELWTLKESYIKAVGRGLSMPLDSFTVKLPEKNKTVSMAGESGKTYYFRKYELGSDYEISVCSLENEFAGTIVIENHDLICRQLYAGIGAAV
jgi:4'-phosphopantetheinyl transferase